MLLEVHTCSRRSPKPDQQRAWHGPCTHPPSAHTCNDNRKSRGTSWSRESGTLASLATPRVWTSSNTHHVQTDGDGPVCLGTVLSRTQYTVDIDEWAYQDARLEPRGRMTPEEAAHWTAAGLEQARAAQSAG
jgi:hypothetical protein